MSPSRDRGRGDSIKLMWGFMQRMDLFFAFIPASRWVSDELVPRDYSMRGERSRLSPPLQVKCNALFIVTSRAEILFCLVVVASQVSS